MLVDKTIEMLCKKYNLDVNKIDDYLRNQTISLLVAEKLAVAEQDYEGYVDRQIKNYLKRGIS
jgi:hypothetical protein